MNILPVIQVTFIFMLSFFGQEASFLPAIDTLPGSYSVKKEVMLMTIWLASCGQVAMDQCEGQVPDKVLGAANIYLALVTWLLSLVSAVTWHKKLWVLRAVFGPPVNT